MTQAERDQNRTKHSCVYTAVSTVVVSQERTRQCRLVLGLVHTTKEEFENGGFTLKTTQMFSVHTIIINNNNNNNNNIYPGNPLALAVFGGALQIIKKRKKNYT